MNLLKKIIHPNLENIEGNCFERVSARGVIMKDDNVLLMYTQRYNDYTFPGGGIDQGENLYNGLKRELLEETGAIGVNILKEIGYIEDYRPYTKENYDLIHELAYFFLCTVEGFQEAQLEEYEIENGMRHVWIPIDEAINHNKKMVEKKGDFGLAPSGKTIALEIINKYLR